MKAQGVLLSCPGLLARSPSQPTLSRSHSPCPRGAFCLDLGLANFLQGQIVDIFGFAGIVSVASPRLCHCKGKDAHKWALLCFNKTLFTDCGLNLA